MDNYDQEYQSMAEELLDVFSNMQRAKAERHMQKRVTGRSFVLAYLRINQNVYPKNLAETMMVSSARIAILLRDLETDGLIKKTIDPKDNRQVIVSLTAEGSAQSQERYEEILNKTKTMLEYLGIEDARHYLRIRKKLLKMSL